MRYQGQGHELAVDVPWEPLGLGSNEDLQARFDATIRDEFGRNVGGIAAGEVVSRSLSVYGPRYPDDAGQNLLSPSATADARHGQTRRFRKVFDPRQSGFKSVLVAERLSLPPNETFAGPAIIVERQTSIVVSEEFDARVLETYDMELRRRAPATAGEDA